MNPNSKFHDKRKLFFVSLKAVYLKDVFNTLIEKKQNKKLIIEELENEEVIFSLQQVTFS